MTAAPSVVTTINQTYPTNRGYESAILSFDELQAWNLMTEDLIRSLVTPLCDAMDRVIWIFHFRTIMADKYVMGWEDLLAMVVQCLPLGALQLATEHETNEWTVLKPTQGCLCIPIRLFRPSRHSHDCYSALHDAIYRAFVLYTHDVVGAIGNAYISTMTSTIKSIGSNPVRLGQIKRISTKRSLQAVRIRLVTVSWVRDIDRSLVFWLAKALTWNRYFWYCLDVALVLSLISGVSQRPVKVSTVHWRSLMTEYLTKAWPNYRSIVPTLLGKVWNRLPSSPFQCWISFGGEHLRIHTLGG
jgi:hypothetical protein